MSRFGALITLVSCCRLRLPHVIHPALSTVSHNSHCCGRPVVRLLPGMQPHDEIEQDLYAVLVDGPLPIDALVDRVAERLLHLEVSEGGGAADIGLLGSRIYKPEVAATVTALDGFLLHVQPPVAADISSADGSWV